MDETRLAMAGRLRILTANLWNGCADPERFAQLLQDEAVDVVCVQELGPDQADALASVLPHGRLEPATDHNGMGIALRGPAEVGQLALRCRPLRSARLDPKEWPGLAEPLCIWNAHVCAPHCFPVLRSLAIRRHQLKELLGHLRARDPRRLVLAGDFNATPAWPLYRLLAEELRDAALDAATRRGKSAPPTWGPWSGAPRLLRIDHAFVRGVEVLDARTLRVAGSDHDALCVDVALE